MNDRVIRENFRRKVLHRYYNTPDTLVVDELGLRHGRCRADIAVINGTLLGFEIKSEDDSLKRLQEQIHNYSAVFDHASVVTASKHLSGVLTQLPSWWGVFVCHEESRSDVQFEVIRDGTCNPQVEPIAVAQLLWKAEVALILKCLGEPPTVLRQRREVLYTRLAAVLEITDLQCRVRKCLRRRRNWRHLGPPSRGGD